MKVYVRDSSKTPAAPAELKMAVEEGTSGGGTTIIDEYEFRESDDDVRRAEQLCSHTALSYAPSGMHAFSNLFFQL